jgi:hypothetical protein
MELLMNSWIAKATVALLALALQLLLAKMAWFQCGGSDLIFQVPAEEAWLSPEGDQLVSLKLNEENVPGGVLALHKISGRRSTSQDPPRVTVQAGVAGTFSIKGKFIGVRQDNDFLIEFQENAPSKSWRSGHVIDDVFFDGETPYFRSGPKVFTAYDSKIHNTASEDACRLAIHSGRYHVCLNSDFVIARNLISANVCKIEKKVSPDELVFVQSSTGKFYALLELKARKIVPFEENRTEVILPRDFPDPCSTVVVDDECRLVGWKDPEASQSWVLNVKTGFIHQFLGEIRDHGYTLSGVKNRILVIDHGLASVLEFREPSPVRVAFYVFAFIGVAFIWHLVTATGRVRRGAR